MKQVLDFRTCVPIEEAVDYMIQLASALDYAHQHGIVHRDVKPDNLYVMGDGTIKLGDFGIAQTDASSQLTSKDSEIVGSVHYLAPEITSGRPATGQSDIYSAGVTFFELITGHVPYIKNSAIDIAVAHVKEKFPSPKKYLPNCPKEIERIIFKCVKKNPSERYKTAKELHDDLVALKGEKGLKEKKGFFRRLFGFK